MANPNYLLVSVLTAVLVDMDGVLYDSMRFHARAWKEVADAHLLISTEEDFYLLPLHCVYHSGNPDP